MKITDGVLKQFTQFMDYIGVSGNYSYEEHGDKIIFTYEGGQAIATLCDCPCHTHSGMMHFTPCCQEGIIIERYYKDSIFNSASRN